MRALSEIAAAFLKLGCISFGGPVAHLGYFREEFVRRRRWLDDDAYADLIALCQFLPGPASSQAVFALGLRRGGLAGALLASLCFTLPSAALMIGFAYGVGAWGSVGDAGWLRGLKLAAVAVVAHAVWSMAKTLCPDRARASLALAAAAGALLAPSSWGQIAAIALGAAAGRALLANRDAAPTSEPHPAMRRGWAAAALLAFFLLLVGLPIAAQLSGDDSLRIFDGFYRSGSLVFGGGHVVLPLLRAEVVPPGWIDDGSFLAGYSAAQALPGPLFAFSGFLGAAIDVGPGGWLGGLWALLALFLPAWLLIGGALPFWQSLRARPGFRAALAGANAAVVGVLLAALYDPIWVEAVGDARDVALALAAFALLAVWRLPAWLIVALAAAAGQWLL